MFSCDFNFKNVNRQKQYCKVWVYIINNIKHNYYTLKNYQLGEKNDAVT